MVRLNGEVARIIFAARNMTPDLDARFVRSIESFRKLQGGEAQGVRALRLAIARTSGSESAESLARRMGAPGRGIDLFLMLNGLQKGRPLEAGQRYKLVVE